MSDSEIQEVVSNAKRQRMEQVTEFAICFASKQIDVSKVEQYLSAYY